MSAKKATGAANDWGAVVRRLDILIALQLTNQPSSDPTRTKDQIRKLRGLGVDNGTIGQILGKTSSYVSASVGSDEPQPKRPKRAKRVPKRK